MQELNRVLIPIDYCHSLCWSGDELVDWVSGGRRISLDKGISNPFFDYPYRFDHAIVSPSQDYVALYERLGTRCLLLRKGGEAFRLINRSFYYAKCYEYPIAFINLPDGRTGIVHCPHSCTTLEIEEVESGECLTQRGDDFFHSRLVVSADNRYLLDAGWVWHPIDMVVVYDMKHVYSEPSILDMSSTLRHKRLLDYSNVQKHGVLRRVI